MISEIIQKEKERQESILEQNTLQLGTESHKQSLINLKEYMEDVLINISKLNLILVEIGIRIQLFNMMKVITEDIKELTKIIERYE